MRDQIHESEWILSCQRSVRLKLGCIKDLCCHLFFLVREDVLTEFFYADNLMLLR